MAYLGCVLATAVIIVNYYFAMANNCEQINRNSIQKAFVYAQWYTDSTYVGIIWI